jgi:histidine triad (HIT) family protein
MKNCIFCKIINKEIPAEIILENENFIAIKDINPAYKEHYLIITKQHIESVNSINETNEKKFYSIFLFAKQLAKQVNIDTTGYRLLINNGENAGQEVKHFHMHLLGGEKLRNL